MMMRMGKIVQIKLRVRPSMAYPWMLQECETSFFGLVQDWYDLRGFNTREEAILAKEAVEGVLGIENPSPALKTEIIRLRAALARIEGILSDYITPEEDTRERALDIARTALNIRNV
jgi:hypothetical protein